MWAVALGAVNLQVVLRLATWRFPSAAPTMGLMRAAVAALAVFGYGALAAALGVSLANGDGSGGRLDSGRAVAVLRGRVDCIPAPPGEPCGLVAGRCRRRVRRQHGAG